MLAESDEMLCGDGLGVFYTDDQTNKMMIKNQGQAEENRSIQNNICLEEWIKLLMNTPKERTGSGSECLTTTQVCPVCEMKK